MLRKTCLIDSAIGEREGFMFCSNCGTKIEANAKFCSNCSKEVDKPTKTSKIIPVLKKVMKIVVKTARLLFAKTKTWFMALDMIAKIIVLVATLTFVTFVMLKTSMLGFIIAMIIFIVTYVFRNKVVGVGLKNTLIMVAIPSIAVIITFALTTPFNNTNTVKDTDIESSVVSKGVNLDDLGNIFNGQFYFDDGTNQFYSTFDEKGDPHIYVTNKKSGNTKPIFNGFGWSLVMHDGWLYFSGNEGKRIDGTYNIFRMKADGSSLKRINNMYCFNMNFYQQWLYYVKQNSADDKVSSIYRSSLDGSNETEIVSNTGGLSVIYENKLYYLDQYGYIFVADPDGNNKVKLLNDKVSYFIIGQGKVIYVDSTNNIKTAKIDGTDIKMVRFSDNYAISKINSYKDTIFYIKYDEAYVSERYAYRYYIYSIKTDGTNDVRVYDGISWGFYVNILNNKVFVLDYAQDLLIDKLVAITRNMSLSGNTIKDLYRK